MLIIKVARTLESSRINFGGNGERAAAAGPGVAATGVTPGLVRTVLRMRSGFRVVFRGGPLPVHPEDTKFDR